MRNWPRNPIVVITVSLIVAVSINPAGADRGEGDVMEQASKYHVTENKPVESDDAQRKQWSLSVEEWSRYKTLMRGIRSSISPATISPIEVLGTHARNDQERKKYAEMWAQMMFEDAERVLAFQAAYNAAFKKLYGNVQLIDIDQIRPQNQRQSALTLDSRLLVFVKVDKCFACEQLVKRVIDNQSFTKNQIDIYFVDTKPGADDKKIRQWVAKQKIDTARIKSGKITLNHDHGNLYKITKKVDTSIPIAFKMNAESLTTIKL